MKPLPYVRFALALSLASVTGHSLAEALHTQVDEVIEPLMREHDIAGMAVAVIADGKEHYFTYGVANKANAQPVKRDTLFEVGSLSKTYTATLVALASAQGTLALDAPPNATIRPLKARPWVRPVCWNWVPTAPIAYRCNSPTTCRPKRRCRPSISTGNRVLHGPLSAVTPTPA